VGVLRRADPGCADRRWWGRTALLPAACWLGGLGLRPAALGSAAGAAAVLACLLALRGRRQAGAPAGILQLMDVPLVAGVLVALATSLAAA
jgi:hypothetical protein